MSSIYSRCSFLQPKLMNWFWSSLASFDHNVSWDIFSVTKNLKLATISLIFAVNKCVAISRKILVWGKYLSKKHTNISYIQCLRTSWPRTNMNLHHHHWQFNFCQIWLAFKTNLWLKPNKLRLYWNMN